ncbi:hypothetical protein C4X99_22340 [Leptospira interrogans serovar Geyaweera]|nr:hypothetical protein C4X99_22340 [Leptospira interrogans serovar Geyaweera]
MFPKLRRIFSSSFHSHLLPLFLEKKVSTFMLLGQCLRPSITGTYKSSTIANENAFFPFDSE